MNGSDAKPVSIGPSKLPKLCAGLPTPHCNDRRSPRALLSWRLFVRSLRRRRETRAKRHEFPSDCSEEFDWSELSVTGQCLCTDGSDAKTRSHQSAVLR